MHTVKHCEAVKHLTRMSQGTGKAAQLAAMALLYIENVTTEPMSADDARALATFFQHYRSETGECLLDMLAGHASDCAICARLVRDFSRQP